MYIFGGRMEEGVDLGDFVVFRIIFCCWYIFQNMGLFFLLWFGYSMIVVGKFIIVVGGELSLVQIVVNDFVFVYCLDIIKICYFNDVGFSQILFRN